MVIPTRSSKRIVDRLTCFYIMVVILVCNAIVTTGLYKYLYEERFRSFLYKHSD